MSKTRVSRSLVVLLLVPLALTFLPTWLWLVRGWMSDPYYSHGPLVLVGAFFFAWVQRRAFVTITPAPLAGGLALVGAGLAIHLLALPWQAFWISALTLPVIAAGILVTLFGVRLTSKFIFPLAFLIFMVPLPLAEHVGPPLEALAASASTDAVNLVGANAVHVGSQIFLPASASQFTVGVPCGGLYSLIAITTLAAALTFIMQGAWWARLLVFLLAVPISLAANIVRLTILFGIANAWGADAGLSYFHNWASPVLFLVALGLTLIAARLLRCDQPAWDLIVP